MDFDNTKSPYQEYESITGTNCFWDGSIPAPLVTLCISITVSSSSPNTSVQDSKFEYPRCLTSLTSCLGLLILQFQYRFMNGIEFSSIESLCLFL